MSSKSLKREPVEDEELALLKAIRSGDIGFVRKYAKEDNITVDKLYHTESKEIPLRESAPLIVALNNRQYEIAKVLQENGANSRALTPEQIACVFNMYTGKDGAIPHYGKIFIDTVPLNILSKLLTDQMDNNNPSLLCYALDRGADLEGIAFMYAGDGTVNGRRCLYAIATHPKYPIEKRMILNRLVLPCHLSIDGHGLSKEDIGNAGEPNPFACMAHVWDFIDHLPINKRPSEPIFSYYNTHQWVQKSQKLASYTSEDASASKKINDAWDMFRSYTDQVVLPCIRYHIPAEIFANLHVDNIIKIREIITLTLFMEEIIPDKNFSEILQLSDKWHEKRTIMDADIRTVPSYIGDWPALLADRAPLKVEDTIAEGWTIKNTANGKELQHIGDLMNTCIAGKTEECANGLYHVFTFYNPQKEPSSTLRVSVIKKPEHVSENIIAIADSPYAFHIEDYTNFGNRRDFSEGDTAAYNWLIQQLETGKIKIQAHPKKETNDEFLNILAIERMERVIGFPLFSSDTEMLHNNAFHIWGHEALEPTDNIVSVLPGVEFNRKTALTTHTYRHTGPDISSKHGKYMVPEIYRGTSAKTYHYASGQDKMLRRILAEMIGEEHLLPPEPYELPWGLRVSQTPVNEIGNAKESAEQRR